jgi:uncharacterized protein YjbI with pentapeptide repeats
MGNTISSSVNEQNNMDSLASQIDDIAIHYILTQNTIDLLRLTDKEYYDNLIILTSSVIEKKLNNLELGFLDQRILGKKKIVDSIDIIPASNKLKDKVVFNISKFYIKIIMIYSAIATTIDPQYSYQDDNGTTKSFYLKDIEAYKHIPKNVRPVLIQLTNPMNLCRKRLSILKNKLDDNVDDEYVKINPGEKLCSISTTNLLTDEVGIKELDLLYYDIFDYETKTWNKRSKKMKQKYHKDLTLFYQIFTGKKDKPSSIKSFHDIELLDMSSISNCSDPRFKQDMLILKNNELIKEYIQKINLIENYTKNYRNKLLSLLKELFVIKIKDNETQYTINPDLTLDHVLFIESETRDVILNLYTSCEKYFIQALIIFEKIYDEQSKNMNIERMNYIENIKQPLPENSEQTPPPTFMPNTVSVSPSSSILSNAMPSNIMPSNAMPSNVISENFIPSLSPSTFSSSMKETEKPTSFLSSPISQTQSMPITQPVINNTNALFSSKQQNQPGQNTNKNILGFKSNGLPVNEAPVSGAPVSGAPVSEAPVSEAPVSNAPVSEAPKQGIFDTIFGSKASEAPASNAPVSGAPVSGAPVSGAPVSGAPVSGAPVSGAPVSGAPVSGAPVSEAPVSEPPKQGIFDTIFGSKASEAPASNAPVSGAPVSGAPVSGAPVSGALVSGAPVSEPPKQGIFDTIFGSKASEAPINKPPVSNSPVSEAPVSEAPVSEAPVSEAPVSEAPVSEAPKQGIFDTIFGSKASERPVNKEPLSEAPLSEAPLSEAPVSEAPLSEAPLSEAPLSEAPLSEAPVSNSPVSEAPVSEAPLSNAPVSEAPVSEAPVSEAPVRDAYVTELPISEPTISEVPKFNYMNQLKTEPMNQTLNKPINQLIPKTNIQPNSQIK